MLGLQVAEAKLYRAQSEQELGLRDLDGCLAAVLPVMPLILQSRSLRLQGLMHYTFASFHLRQPDLELIRNNLSR